MAYFARVDNGVVTQVVSVPDSEESRGDQYLAVDLGLSGTWIQTSYNTIGGVHILGGTPLRKNYAGVGYTYDEVLDAFIPPKPHESWVLDEVSCLWVPPIPRPDDSGTYMWDEEALGWVLVS